MQHIFLINPLAGKGKALAEIKPEIESYCEENNIDYQIIIPDAAGKTTQIVKEMADTGNEYRFYACGGDGTLYEVVNGAYNHPNAQVAVLPLGSGNDFIRLFGKKEDFLDLDAQMNGTVVVLDAIKSGDRVAINQCSMGLDAEVCAKQAYFKKSPLLNGESAYYASLLYCIRKKTNLTFTITIDDGEPFTQKTLFCLCANSRWYGGGFKGAPLAEPDDGWLDFVIMKNDMNLMQMLPMINVYKEGRHLDMERVKFVRGKKLTVHSDSLAAVNFDGECEYVYDRTFEIIEKAVNFVVPSTSLYLINNKE
ncbi:MAG: diacylglycerol kinase family lipid kinase [Clostridiales bacterium]|nr:diacylglycerol kinase family lipid kinase [Clostridiales bacterium]